MYTMMYSSIVALGIYFSMMSSARAARTASHSANIMELGATTVTTGEMLPLHVLLVIMNSFCGFSFNQLLLFFACRTDLQ